MKLARGVAIVSLVFFACRSAPPPYPSVVVFIDTDLPVPLLASTLRVDVVSVAGAWVSSRDVSLRSPSDYPASFSVFVADDERSEDVLVRLRIHPDNAERDYRGERFRAAPTEDMPPATVVPIPAGDGQPRLVENGIDVTPPREPLPELTVDRVVRIALRPGAPSSIHVVLRGACGGRMADIANAMSCIDEAHPWDVANHGDAAPETSLVGSIGAHLADPPVPKEDTVAIRGGLFILGTDELPTDRATNQIVTAFPPRMAAINGFAMDRDEVSVAKTRAAIATGFVPPTAIRDNPGPLATTSIEPDASCTWRLTPDPDDPDRETLPLTCVQLETARALCQFFGGDLPTEAQWEYAATMSGRSAKSRYPWGDAEPTCAGVVFARFDDTQGSTICHDAGFPFGARGAATASQDVTPDGVRNLGGVVSEWVRGAPLPYDSACFQRTTFVDPLCEADGDNTIRGGDYISDPEALEGAVRSHLVTQHTLPITGFRCVYAP